MLFQLTKNEKQLKACCFQLEQIRAQKKHNAEKIKQTTNQIMTSPITIGASAVLGALSTRDDKKRKGKQLLWLAKFLG